ncbi:flagellar hook-length control protein FliK [Frigidibacter oleivorans]|uniref:flagellar hook-length control protein FliK n=1 Tax=Frigidibacter oleivorans TaxID=2487129 RepID=UPI0013DF035F|nr:flagellar hook-length control protein FliK [Frigidibacter oleivorans]
MQRADMQPAKIAAAPGTDPPRPAAAPPPAPFAALPAAPDEPAVLRQVADHLATGPDRPVELTLAPEELGRLRLTLTPVDGGMTLSVAAERPETLDLLRRNIDGLARELQSLGYAELSFSFAQDQRHPRDPPAGPLPRTAPDGPGVRPGTAATPPATAAMDRPAGSALDLRL